MNNTDSVSVGDKILLSPRVDFVIDGEEESGRKERNWVDVDVDCDYYNDDVDCVEIDDLFGSSSQGHGQQRILTSLSTKLCFLVTVLVVILW